MSVPCVGSEQFNRGGKFELDLSCGIVDLCVCFPSFWEFRNDFAFVSKLLAQNVHQNSFEGVILLM